MRKVIYAINLSMDGCCDHTKALPTDEILYFFAKLTREVDLLVFGRVTYQLMVPYWPDVAKDPSGQTKAGYDYAQAFDSTKKLVFSRSLESVDDKNTRISRANLKDEILKLKGEKGKDILVGGVDLPSQLTELGLIDEYLFVVHPVVSGKGRRLFDDVSLQERLVLRLAGTETLASGHVALRYERLGR